MFPNLPQNHENLVFQVITLRCYSFPSFFITFSYFSSKDSNKRNVSEITREAIQAASLNLL